MFNLIKNEWMKIFRRPGTYVMIALLIVITCIVGAFLNIKKLAQILVRIRIGSKHCRKKTMP